MLKKGPVFNKVVPKKYDLQTGDWAKLADCAWFSVFCDKWGGEADFITCI